MNTFKIILFFVILISFTSCGLSSKEKYKIQEPSLELIFVGDVMTTPDLERSKENGKYDVILRDVKDLLFPPSAFPESDIRLANFEFVVDTNLKAIDYPSFNGTKEYLAYFASNFNYFTVANNHFNDRGGKVAKNTIKLLRTNNAIVVGGDTKGEKNVPPTLYSFGYNTVLIAGYTLVMNNRNIDFPINYYKNKDEIIEKAKKDLAATNETTFNVVCLHFGDEWTTNVKPEERELAYALADAGFDAIIGSHPHVPRDAEYYTTKDGRRAVIFYSLGNFYSTHGADTKFADMGLIVKLSVRSGRKYGVTVNPTYTLHYGKDDIYKRIKEKRPMPSDEEKTIVRVLDLNKAIENIDKGNKKFLAYIKNSPRDNIARMKEAKEYYDRVFTNMTER